MAVQLPNSTLGIRRRPRVRDAHGYDVPGAPGPGVGPWPGRVQERADGTFLLALDPGAWPLERGDLVVEPGARVWTVLTADLLENNASDVVNYVRVEAHARHSGWTEP